MDLRSALLNANAPDWIIDTRFHGPWLSLARPKQAPEPLLPLPARLVRKEGGGWLRAEPYEKNTIPGWMDANGLLPLWRKGKPDTKAGSGFLTLSGLLEFLHKRSFCDAKFFRANELYDFDHRTGIRVDMDTLTSAEGELYGIRLLALKPRVRDE